MPKKDTYFFLSVLFLLSGILYSSAQDTLYLSKNDQFNVGGKNLAYLLESKPVAGIEEIIFFDSLGYFKVSSENYLTNNIGKAHWVKFIVKNDANHPASFVIEFQDPWTGKIEVFEHAKGASKRYNLTGVNLPFESRGVKHKNFVFLPLLSAQSSSVFYVRLQSDFSSDFVFKVRNLPFFIWYATTEYYFLGMFYGIILLVLVYNITLFLLLKERIYLYYISYIISCGLYAMNEDGTAFQYIWPNNPVLNKWVVTVTPLLFVTTFALYSRQFLQIKGRSLFVDRLLTFLLVAYSAIYVLPFTGIKVWDISSYFSAIVFFLIFVLGIDNALKGYKPAYYFVGAYSFVILGVMINILRNAGYLEGGSYYTTYGLNVGFLVEVIVLSFALGERLKLEKAEKEKSREQLIVQLMENEKLKDFTNKELEKQVEVRTLEISQRNQELAEANSKLMEQSREIERMNLLLAEDNKVLQQDVREQTKARAMAKDMSFEEFARIFPDDLACLKYISDIKWTVNYQCKRCNNTKFFNGRAPYSRRCTHCGYEESATNATIFHRCKIPLHKAFYMVYLVSSRREDVTSEELSNTLQIRQKTCWSFKQKIIQAGTITTKSGKKKQIKDWNVLILSSPPADSEE